MKKILFAAVAVIGIYGVSEGMFASHHSLLPHSSTGYSARYFPLSTETLGRHDPALWKTIADLGRPLRSKSGTEYYDALVESAKAITSPDLRFAILIEVGNLAATSGSDIAFQKARSSLFETINSINQNVALTGLKNQMLSYCFIEKDKYIPDHMECWNNRGSLVILINLASGIKGGDKALRKEVAILCRVLLEKLEEFKSKS